MINNNLDLDIREVESKDVSELVPFFNSGIYYPPYKTPEILRWWILESLIPVITYCAFYNDEIVGTFSVFKRKLTNNLNCGILMGLVVKKEFRGTAIFRILGEKAMNKFEDMDLFICLPNMNGAKALEKNFNFKTIGKVETMINSDIRNINGKECTIEIIDHRTKYHCIKQKTEKFIMFESDYKFWKWKYAIHPIFTHNIFYFSKEEYIIIKIFTDEDNGKKFGDIVDYVIPSLDKEGIYNLLSNACSNINRLDLDVITIQALPNSLLHYVAKEMGFKSSKHHHHFCLKVKDKRHNYLFEPKNWLIKWGDYLR